MADIHYVKDTNITEEQQRELLEDLKALIIKIDSYGLEKFTFHFYGENGETLEAGVFLVEADDENNGLSP